MTNQINEAADRQAPTPGVEGGGGIPGAALFFFAVLLIFAGGMAVYFATQFGDAKPGGVAVKDPDSQLTPGPDWIEEFKLTERTGKIVGSEDLRGKVWVVNFFFSTCPGTCRQQTTLVSGLERDFRDQDVRFVSITCDPRVDTTDVLRKYAVNFEAPDDWWFLTGDLAYIRRIGAEFFQLAVSEKGHQDRLAVVDKWGNVRGRFNWHEDVQLLKMKDLIHELLAETEPPAEEGGGEVAAESGPRERPRDPYEEEEEEEEEEQDASENKRDSGAGGSEAPNAAARSTEAGDAE